jgi:hypothetical protein
VTRSIGIANVAVLGAITVVLWLSPAAAADQGLPGATVESVVAIAKRLNPTLPGPPNLKIELRTTATECLARGSL